jgi:hypothetical protein
MTDQDLCERCKLHPDTLVHRLAECSPATRTIWRWLSRKLASITGADANTIRPQVLILPDLPAPTAARRRALTWLLGVSTAFLLEHREHSVFKFTMHLKAMKEQASGKAKLSDALRKFVK